MQDARSLAAPVAVLRNPQAAGNQGGREQTPDYSSSTGFQHVLTRAEHETARSSPPQLLLTSSLSASLVSKSRLLMGGPLLLQVPYFHDHCHLSRL